MLSSLKSKLRKLISAPRKLLKQKKEATEKETAYQKQVESTILKVMKLAGWDYDFAREKFLDAHRRTGCTPKEFVLYKFYELTDEQQEQMFLICMQKKLREKYDASREFVNIICNKERTNQYFAECVRRPWCVNTKVSLDQFREIFRDTPRIMYKPIAGHRGYGIEAFYLNPGNMEEVYKQLSGYPAGVVEAFIVQHPEMSRLSPSSVNSIRFVTFSSNTTPVTPDGKMMDVAYSIVRIGRGKSIVDNLHSGGMVANVDLQTGRLATDGADRRGKLWVRHPETGTVIKGFQVPCFNEAREMVEKAIADHQVEGYLGWDIGISEDGPMLLEVNTCPGSDGLQTAYAQEGKGMKHIMDKYL